MTWRQRKTAAEAPAGAAAKNIDCITESILKLECKYFRVSWEAYTFRFVTLRSTEVNWDNELDLKTLREKYIQNVDAQVKKGLDLRGMNSAKRARSAKAMKDANIQRQKECKKCKEWLSECKCLKPADRIRCNAVTKTGCSCKKFLSAEGKCSIKSHVPRPDDEDAAAHGDDSDSSTSTHSTASEDTLSSDSTDDDSE